MPNHSAATQSSDSQPELKEPLFGRALQALRKSQKLTQIDLSEQAQLSKSYISY